LVEVFAAAVKSALSNLQLRTSLHEQATHDVLTRLFNRRYLDETLPRELHRSQRAKEPVSVAMIDVDHFKLLNDTYGHEAGDQVLETLGRLLREHLRFSDIACRFGGEEFIIVMPGTHAAQAQGRLEQLRALIGHHAFVHQARSLGKVTVSVGIAQSPLHGTTKDDLLRQADQALYMAKEQGRDRTVVAPPLATS
jgi:diguanylate cyclase (GGDEF)-like protein